MILTTSDLRAMCDLALKRRFSNGPNDKFWKEVDPHGKHVVGFWFVHRPWLPFWRGVKHPWDFRVGGGKNIRAEVLCKMKGTTKPVYLLCDFDYADFTKRRNEQGDTSKPRLVLEKCFAA